MWFMRKKRLPVARTTKVGHIDTRGQKPTFLPVESAGQQACVAHNTDDLARS